MTNAERGKRASHAYDETVKILYRKYNKSTGSCYKSISNDCDGPRGLRYNPYRQRIAGMNIMEGRNDLLAELKQKFIPTFQTSCCFWLPAQALNFLVVPPMARVAYVASCSFLWVNILCFIKRKEIVTADEPLTA